MVLHNECCNDKMYAAKRRALVATWVLFNLVFAIQFN